MWVGRTFKNSFLLLWGWACAFTGTLQLTHAADSKCAVTLIHTPTENFIAYVTELHEQRIVEDTDLLVLAHFDAEAPGARVQNPIPAARATTNTAAAIHRQALAELIAKGNLDPQEIELWVKQTIEQQNTTQKKRQRTKKKTENSSYKMKFHRIPPGEFYMGRGQDSVEVTLTHTIEVMSTPVTQKMWVDLMGKNPSHFQGKNHGDHPVENVSWYSAIAYANALSKKHGLKPAYDLRELKFEAGTHAEDGTLDVEFRTIDTPNINIYRSRGYRLPTEAEAEYVLKAAGKFYTKYHFGDNENDLHKYAWYKANSDSTTHPVAELLPLTIGRKHFYDLYGNVWEWTNDWNETVYNDEPVKGGKNPTGPKSGPMRVYRGGSWTDHADTLRADRRSGRQSGETLSFVGFRLVRTIK